MADRVPMSLALLYGAAGSHPASWLHAESRRAPPTDLAAYTNAARTAERGLFDLFFIADTPAARTDNLHAWSRFPLFMNVLEPVTLLTALAGVTTRIGLGGTVSTSFSEPYNVARQFASLDHLSSGRAPGMSSPPPTTTPRAISATPSWHHTRTATVAPASSWTWCGNSGHLGRRSIRARPRQRPVF